MSVGHRNPVTCARPLENLVEQLEVLDDAMPPHAWGRPRAEVGFELRTRIVVVAKSGLIRCLEPAAAIITQADQRVRGVDVECILAKLEAR